MSQELSEVFEKAVSRAKRANFEFKQWIEAMPLVKKALVNHSKDLKISANHYEIESDRFNVIYHLKIEEIVSDKVEGINVPGFKALVITIMPTGHIVAFLGASIEGGWRENPILKFYDPSHFQKADNWKSETGEILKEYFKLYLESYSIAQFITD